MPNLFLDPAIRDWVLLPIVSVMFLVVFARHYLTKALSAEAPQTPLPASSKKDSKIYYDQTQTQKQTQSTNAKDSALIPSASKKGDLRVLRRSALLSRSRRLRTNAALLPPGSWDNRQRYFADKSSGQLSLQLPTQAELGMQGALASNPMMDPKNMLPMLKRQFSFMIPQMLIMGWVSFFFSGFIVLQLPFGWLTPAFKPMLQRGLESLSSLDISYVSSLSWYFICAFGMSKLTDLVLGEANLADDTAIMQQQMAMQTGMGQAGQAPDTSKLYNDERDYVELVQHRWALEDAERRLLAEKL